MKIVMTGGGSGGHITPILAVARELKQLCPDAEIIYIGQKGDSLSDIPAADPNIDAVYSVWAGKLRRYSGEGWKQLLDIPTQAQNIRDIFRLGHGLVQSYRLLRKLRPDVVFSRGGFVSVPVALGGKMAGVPYITHDSDSTPSLANRLIARWADIHAVALPKNLYPYPQAKTEVVGVPVGADYQLVTPRLQAQYRRDLQLPADAKVVLLTGGGNGARVLNQALVANAVYLLGTFPQLHLLHIAGRSLEAETLAAYDASQLPGQARNRVHVESFVTNLHEYSGAADVVIARGGATNLAEFAMQGVACLIVPSKQLGWNVKNAEVLSKEHAIVQLDENQVEQPERLGRAVGALLSDDTARQQIATKIHSYAKPNATTELAEIIIRIANRGAHATPKK